MRSTFYQKSLAIRERRAAADPENADAQRDLSVSYNTIGNMTLQSGRTKEALGLYQKATAIHERLAAAHPENADAQRDLSIGYDKLGNVTLQLGRTQGGARLSIRSP